MPERKLKSTAVPPITEQEILDRLAQGPARYQEFARTKGSQSHARKAARKLVDKLVAEGRIKWVGAGTMKYLIANDEESHRKAIQLHIDSSSRYRSACDCIVWEGSYAPHANEPVFRVASLTDGRWMRVRRWLWEDMTGKKLKRSDNIKAQPGCEDGCINRDHLIKTSLSETRKGRKVSVVTRMKLEAIVAARHNKAKDYVDLIRTSDKTATELARELGLSKSNVRHIKNGNTFKYRSTGGMFSHLIAANHGRQAA